MRTTMIGLLALALFTACGEPPDDISAAEMASLTQHWTLNPHTDQRIPECGAFADIPASSPDCKGIATTREGPGGECSVGCFGPVGNVRVAVGCKDGCSSEYGVSFR